MKFPRRITNFTEEDAYDPWWPGRAFGWTASGLAVAARITRNHIT